MARTARHRRSLREIGREGLDDPVDFITDSHEVPEACSGLAYAYAEGRLTHHAHIRVWSRTGVFNSEDLCLTISPKRLKSDSDALARVAVGDEEVVQRFLAGKVNRKVGQVDKAMLVVVREVSEHGEGTVYAW